MVVATGGHDRGRGWNPRGCWNHLGTRSRRTELEEAQYLEWLEMSGAVLEFYSLRPVTTRERLKTLEIDWSAES